MLGRLRNTPADKHSNWKADNKGNDDCGRGMDHRIKIIFRPRGGKEIFIGQK